MLQAERKAIERLRYLLRMDDKAFSMWPYERVAVTGRPGEPDTEMTGTAYVVESTRLWRGTWVLPLLDALLDEDAPGRVQDLESMSR